MNRRFDMSIINRFKKVTLNRGKVNGTCESHNDERIVVNNLEEDQLKLKIRQIVEKKEVKDHELT